PIPSSSHRHGRDALGHRSGSNTIASARGGERRTCRTTAPDSHRAVSRPPRFAEQPHHFQPWEVLDAPILHLYPRRCINCTGPQVAASLESLHERTAADEIMLVTMGASRAVHARTVELIAELPRSLFGRASPDSSAAIQSVVMAPAAKFELSTVISVECTATRMMA